MGNKTGGGLNYVASKRLLTFKVEGKQVPPASYASLLHHSNLRISRNNTTTLPNQNMGHIRQPQLHLCQTTSRYHTWKCVGVWPVQLKHKITSSHDLWKKLKKITEQRRPRSLYG